MILDPKKLSPKEVYHLLTGAIVPRPIAIVTTMNADGKVNTAPYSFFNAVTSSPPLLMISAERKNGAMKHTAENILRTKEFVVNIVTERLLGSMTAASADIPPEVAELEQGTLPYAPSTSLKTPRIQEAPVSLECILHRHLELGDEPADVIIGEIVRFHVSDEVYRDGMIDPHVLRPIARMGGNYYAEIELLFESKRFRIAKKTP
ncbi:MAG TPA: flavin reductase family protein [Bacteroidota bacterium]|nr:flavin reductase family protein [Bacteroidota bacterium]